jgi:adenosylhomocysteine nucleosidase
MTNPVQPRPIFIAALPREVASLVKGDGWQSNQSQRKRGIHLYSNDHAVVSCAGMGAHRASLAVEAALTLGPASELVSVGWAGACNHRFKVGDVIHPTIVIDAKTGERFFIQEPNTTDGSPEILVTVAKPSGIIEKERLEISYYASAVDMEAASVARIARARDLPFHAIKAISDEATFEIPYLSDFTAPNGQFRQIAFSFHLAVRPSLWKPVAILAKGSKLAAHQLCAEIQAHIDQHRSTRP